MNQILETCSTDPNTLSWEEIYKNKIEKGTSIDELMSRLEEELVLKECSLICNHTELENLLLVEEIAKTSIQYQERRAYLQNMIDTKCRKTT